MTGNPFIQSKKAVIGILEWFKPFEYERAEFAFEKIKNLGINHLRTGISWADWHDGDADKWYEWLIPKASKDFELLPCFNFTPPTLGEAPKTSSPPRNLKAYADFIDIMISKYGRNFEWIELWNEPNNIVEWDWRMDKDWLKFCEMVGGAAYWAQQRKKKTLLGGMSPIDQNWLRLMGERGVLKYIDAVGIHGFPGIWDFDWKSWNEIIPKVKNVAYDYNREVQIWISEAGYSTWRHDEYRQIEVFNDLTEAYVDRAYFYALQDLHPERSHIEGFHADERHYNFGMLKHNGKPKMLYNIWERNGLEGLKSITNTFGGNMKSNGRDLILNNSGGEGKSINILRLNNSELIHNNDNHILITGGAGFIGSNLAEAYLSEGCKVMIYDNLSRPGVERNLEWLNKKYGGLLRVEIADIRNKHSVKKAVAKAEKVFHFAAQVAVTTSIDDPVEDFEVNLLGSLNVLESIRNSSEKPPLVYTSTNKVYGNFEDLGIEEAESRYQPLDPQIRRFGFGEYRHLDFHSPYGCSKGAADQYILDYSRTYGLKTAILRMSCIYGPRQFGTEDQGWVAHFLIKALKEEPVIIYGNGKQVRDILYVKDLVRAMKLTQANIKKLNGRAYNMGGGISNSVSLIELLSYIEELSGKRINIEFSDWRRGDQKYYVSDTRLFEKLTGWKAEFPFAEGVANLYKWLKDNKIYELDRKKEIVNNDANIGK